MAKQVTRWSPDTCMCSFDYEWDDALPQEKRVHTIKTIVRACPRHAHHTKKEDHYADALGENQNKGMAVAVAAQTLGISAEEIKWSFDQDGSIVLSHPALTKDVFEVMDKTAFTKPVRLE